jgi:hypothetical protein
MSTPRITQLGQFADTIKVLQLEDDSQFRNFVVTSLEILEMTDRDFADSLSVSRTCVNRWSNGKNLPRIAIRKATVDSVMRRVDRRIRALRQAAIRTNTSTPAPAHAYPIAARGRERSRDWVHHSRASFAKMIVYE